MITGERIVGDLLVTRADVQEIKIAHQNDPLWDDIQNRLDEIISLVKEPIKYRHVYGHQKEGNSDMVWNNYVDKLATNESSSIL